MKVMVSQPQLAHGLNLVSKAVSPRSTLPVLANILIATEDDGRLRLSATNLEQGITAWIPMQGSDGTLTTTIPARIFQDLVNTLPSEMVTLDLPENSMNLTVSCGYSVTSINCIDAVEFPPMPVPDLSEAVELNISDFKEMIQQVAFAASTDDARPVLQGVSLNISDNEVILAATDGFRISVRKASLSSSIPNPVSAIIPSRALTELARIAADGDKTVQMALPKGRGQVIFHLKDAELVSQLIEGNFPDYRVIIPRSSKTRTILSTGQFREACKRSEIIARESNNVVRLNIQPAEGGPGTVLIHATSEETGNTEDRVEANVEGPELLIAFNVQFLNQVLDVIHSAEFSLETNANNTPGLIRPMGDDSFEHVIMPMHLG
jgi:DNA polymerase-3 subunit beta